jgi:hypothetical protein
MITSLLILTKLNPLKWQPVPNYMPWFKCIKLLSIKLLPIFATEYSIEIIYTTSTLVTATSYT